MKKISTYILTFAITISIMSAAAKADDLIPALDEQDTTQTFSSPLSLTEIKSAATSYRNSWGIDLILSEHGFGCGPVFSFGLNKYTSLYSTFFISGARNTDEYQQWDYDRQEYRIPNKVNRLFQMPVTAGLKFYPNIGSLTSTFRPYISAGGGFAWILSTPYNREFFNAFHHSTSYIRPAASLALCADFGIGKSLMSLEIKYYTIPFGGDGLESIRNHPLKDFGGLQLGLVLGMKY